MASIHYFLLFVVLKILITFVYTTDYSSEGYYSDQYDEYAEKEYADSDSSSKGKNEGGDSDLSERESFGMKNIANANGKFTPKLYSEVISKLEGKNVIMSSLSIECLLAVTMLGAKGNTAKEISKTFSFPPDHKLLTHGFRDVMKILDIDEKGSITTEVSNHIYVRKHLKLRNDFEKNVNHIQNGVIEKVDFSDSARAAKAINDQVKKDTKGKITELFSKDAITPNTELILVNALYFKGKWKSEFNKDSTKELDFHISKSKKVKADFMNAKSQYSIVNIKNAKAKALKLPYKGDRFSMVVILPDDKDGIKKLEHDITKINLSEDIQFEKPKKTYHISIPKFKIETSMKLVSTLNRLGVNDLFNSGSADLSGFSGSKGLYASNLVQKAFIEVNEEGTEAAAATGMIVTSRSMQPQPPAFVCDHPFIFYIKDFKTGLILFTGRIMNPAGN